MKRIIGLGAEAHAAVLMELIESAGAFDVSVVLNDDDSIQIRMVGEICVMSVDSSSEWIQRCAKEQNIQDFFMGLNSPRTREKKRALFNHAIACGLKPLGIIHPKAMVSRTAKIGRGACILAGSVVSTKSVLDDNVTVNIGALVESHCRIRSHAQLGAGSFVGCGAEIGECSYIGNGAQVQPNVHIGENVVIAPGAFIDEDIADGEDVQVEKRQLARHNGPNPDPVEGTFRETRSTSLLKTVKSVFSLSPSESKSGGLSETHREPDQIQA
ncbi:MAG: acetyltransferase [Verrucomicrobiota bacterium]|jgi:carbonic anhydrase/acetyltransferase-like protein (isoleucine patch superfamily)